MCKLAASKAIMTIAVRLMCLKARVDGTGRVREVITKIRVSKVQVHNMLYIQRYQI